MPTAEETVWGDTWQYERILQILHDYWLANEDELFVKVKMEFVKANGQTQTKCIKWIHPDARRYDDDSMQSLEELI